mgnify:CR=1 FL=1
MEDGRTQGSAFIVCGGGWNTDGKDETRILGILKTFTANVPLDHLARLIMYELDKSAFGKYTRYHLHHPATGTGFSIVPARGANVLHLDFQGKNILDGYHTPEELEAALRDAGEERFARKLAARLKEPVSASAIRWSRCFRCMAKS